MSHRYVCLYDGGRSGGIRLTDELPGQVRANALAICSRFWERELFYRDDGIKLRAALAEGSSCGESVFTKLLAHTVYNPFRTLAFHYEEVGPYHVDEIKAKICRYLEGDDDILTQFIDGDEILQRLDRVDSFAGLVDLIETMQGKNEAV